MGNTFSNVIWWGLFWKQYYCVYSFQIRDLIKQKLKIAASHYPWRRVSKLFFKLLWLEKMFENTPPWIMTGTFIKSWDNPENWLNKKLKTYYLIYFYALDPCWANVLFWTSPRAFFRGQTIEHWPSMGKEDIWFYKPILN